MLVRAGKSRRAVVFVTKAGGGHLATAEALRDLLMDEFDCDVEFVNPYETILADLDLLGRLGMPSEEVYNRLCLRSRSSGAWWSVLSRVMEINTRLLTRAMRARFLAFARSTDADLLVCPMPIVVQAVVDAARATGKRSLVVMTDIGEVFRGSWVPRGADGFLTCGPKAHAAARAAGAREPVLLDLPLVRAIFSAPFDEVRRAALRRGLGLDETRPTVLVAWGAHGSRRMLDVAVALAPLRSEFQVLFVCGHFDALRDEIEGLQLPYPHRAVGFVRDIADLMRASDLMISKPGGVSSFEAAVLGLPLLLDCGPTTLSHERPNAAFLAARGMAACFTSAGELRAQVARRLRSGAMKPLAGGPPTATYDTARALLDRLLDEGMETGGGAGAAAPQRHSTLVSS